MTIRVTFTLGAEAYREGVREVVHSIQRAAKEGKVALRLSSFFPHYVLALLLAGAFVIWFIPDHPFDAARALVVFAVLHAVLHYIFVSVEMRQLGCTFVPRIYSNVTAEFDDDGIRLVGEAYQKSWNWRLLQQLHALPDNFVLEFVGFDMFVVPRAAFSSETAAAEWESRVRARIAEAS